VGLASSSITASKRPRGLGEGQDPGALRAYLRSPFSFRYRSAPGWKGMGSLP
jgi:hypothetical protein